MRNKKMQARYDTWMIGMKGKYGSTGKSQAVQLNASSELASNVKGIN
jgi:hypothetical protein